MSGTETLTIRADEVRVGDRWHDHEERLDVMCVGTFEGARYGGVRIPTRPVNGGPMLRLFYGAGDPLNVTRALPPPDEEHEAAVRTLVAEGGGVPHRDAIAAV